MLINKGYSEGDIVSFKVVNGDELVAKVVNITPTGYILSKPCVVIPSAQGIGLMQAMFSADPEKDVELKNEHIMMSSPTIDQLQAHYIQTTTGIQTVSKGSIIS